MKSHQAVKGYKLTANTPVDILETFNAPVIMIQNQGSTAVTVTFNDGESLQMSGVPFAYEPLTPISGVIETNGTDVVVFA
jgi:peptide subunit release factor RF-3